MRIPGPIMGWLLRVLLGLALALAAWMVARAVRRRLPDDGLASARIASLRASTHWPGLRRATRPTALLLTFALFVGVDLPRLAAIAAWIASTLSGLVPTLIAFTAILVVVAPLTAFVWVLEQLLHVALDFLDAAFARLAPPHE